MEKFEDVDSGQSARDWWKAISKTARKEIAAEMGIAYQDAVLSVSRDLVRLVLKSSTDW